MQTLLPLTHTVTTERACSMVCIPDRFAAEQELTLIQRKYGARFIKATIRKDRPTKNSTYTLRYHYQDAQTITLF